MMNTLEAIAERRSIRRFKPNPLPDGALEQILKAGIQAPSGHNRQPWRFTVVTGEKHAALIEVFRETVKVRQARGEDVGSAAGTVEAMAGAAATVFVHHPGGLPPWVARSENWQELVDVQSTGGAIENMLLAATHLGIGSLWIADVWEAYEALNSFLEADGLLVAAVSFGLADEAPAARRRKPFDDVVRFL
jgi:nitroreductase